MSKRAKSLYNNQDISKTEAQVEQTPNENPQESTLVRPENMNYNEVNQPNSTPTQQQIPYHQGVDNPGYVKHPDEPPMQVRLCNICIWRPPRKSGLTLKSTKMRVVCYAIF